LIGASAADGATDGSVDGAVDASADEAGDAELPPPAVQAPNSTSNDAPRASTRVFRMGRSSCDPAPGRRRSRDYTSGIRNAL
jgi:hypothetical protein